MGMDPELQRLDLENKWPASGHHPAVRTVEENSRFKTALNSMHFIYSLASIPVIVLIIEGDFGEFPPSFTLNLSDYISRGWCFLEFCLALAFSNIVNIAVHEGVKKLCDDVKAVGALTEEGFRIEFEKKHFTYKGDKRTVLGLFEETVQKSNSGVAARNATSRRNREDRVISPGTGFMSACVRGLCGRDAYNIGKPSILFGLLLRRPESEGGYGVDYANTDSKVVVIGDTLETDIAFANEAGMQSLLVFSGATSRDDLQDSPIQPTWTLDHLGCIGFRGCNEHAA